MERFHSIVIEPASNGISVKIGCISLVYQQTQLNMFHDDLALFLIDPVSAEKQIRKRWHIGQGEDQAVAMEVPETRPSDRAVKSAEKIAERDISAERDLATDSEDSPKV